MQYVSHVKIRVPQKLKSYRDVCIGLTDKDRMVGEAATNAQRERRPQHNIVASACVWKQMTRLSPPPQHNRFTALFRDHPGEPVPEENFWTLWCKGRLREVDTPTIRLGATPSGLSSAHLHHRPCFLQAGCPSCRSTNSVKALKA